MGFLECHFLPTFGREKKICNFCRFSLRNSFAVFKVRVYVEENRQDLLFDREGKFIFTVSVFFIFAVFCSYSSLL